MSLTEVEQEIRDMSPAERRRISALLVALEDQHDLAQRRRLADKMNDPNPERWIPVEDVLRELEEQD